MKKKREEEPMAARCSALPGPSPLGSTASLHVSVDNETEMPVAPQLPLYTLQVPTAATAIWCHGLFTDLPAIEDCAGAAT